MTEMTIAARERLEEYLRQVESALTAASGVDVDEVVTDVRQHVEAVLWTDGFGPADAAADRPVTDATRFRIYSLAKPMTALAAIRLSAQGALDPSAPVQDYVPSFPEREGVITPMHLIRHTSGIRHYADDAEARSGHHCDTVEDALEIFRDDPLVHPPGAAETYSTWGFVLLSGVLEGAAGVPYAEVMRKAVFEPAGMERTVLDDPGREIEGRTAFYRLDPEAGRVPARRVDVTCKWSGGAWLSTAADVGRFLAAALEGELLPLGTVRGLAGGASVYEGMDVGPGGLALARADLDRGVALVVFTNDPGERFGPDLRAAVDELFARLQEAAGP